MEFKKFCEITSMSVSENVIIQTEGMKGDETKVGSTGAARKRKPIGKICPENKSLLHQERCVYKDCKRLHLNTSLLCGKKKP